MSNETNDKIRMLLNEHPDLPVMVLAPSTDGYFSSYYHNAVGASVRGMLFPLEVERLYGSTFGLNPEKYYDDVDDALDDVEGGLWDGVVSEPLLNVRTGGWERVESSHVDWEEWTKTYRPIAQMMVDDMPWREHVVIWAE